MSLQIVCKYAVKKQLSVKCVIWSLSEALQVFCSNHLQVRSEIICTYALCGFANFSSLGIVIGGLCEYLFKALIWSVLIDVPCDIFLPLFSNTIYWSFFKCYYSTASICPSKKGDISALVLRALFTGTCVSLINACIAGKQSLIHSQTNITALCITTRH